MTLLLETIHTQRQHKMSHQIKLKHIQVTDLTLSAGSFDKGITNNLKTAFGFGPGFADEYNRSFLIFFDLTLENHEKGFILKIKSTAHFETDAEIDEDFKNSSFVKISAPAIAFPYIRTFISNLTLNSGYEPIILPSFNFVKMSEEGSNTLEK